MAADISTPVLKDKLTVNGNVVWKTSGAKITSTPHTVKPYEALGWTGKPYGIYALHNWTLSETAGYIGFGK